MFEEAFLFIPTQAWTELKRYSSASVNADRITPPTAMQYAGNTSNDVAQLIPNTVARRVAMLMIAAYSRQAPKRF